MQRTFLKIFLGLLLLIATERFCRAQTAGFRVQKVIGEEFERQEKKPLDPWLLEKLDQPYFFLGSGVQCYAFLSADGQTVLKLFKHYHMPPRTAWLKKVSFLRSFTQEREKRIASILESHRLAFEKLAEETGLLHVQLEPLDTPLQLNLYDKIGILHQLPLEKIPFALQKRADLVFASLEKSFSCPEEAKAKIDSLLAVIVSRCEKGLSNSDPIIHRNFGFIGTRAIEIDAGSFTENRSPCLKKELYFETLELQQWLLERAPELAAYLSEKVLS